MRPFFLPILALAGGCAIEVYHPTRSLEQQKRDIEICKEHGVLSTSYEPIGALNAGFKCLEAKGYRRGRAPQGETSS